MKKGRAQSLIGFEVEFFTLNRNGYTVNAADTLLKTAKQQGRDITIKKECSKNLIEIASFPTKKVSNTMEHLLGELEYLLPIAEKKDILLCPLGTYPGKFSPEMRSDKNYRIKESILGKNRFKIAGRCSGFHCHYTLPHGIFDDHLRILNMLVGQKVKEGFVNSYNFLIAADPALTTFMQSSPYYQGNYIGKDSRIIMYRGGRHLDSTTGLYANFEEFGGLPHYKLTALDIIEIITSRYDRWKSYVKSIGIKLRTLPLYWSLLDTTWNPVKVNPNGTLEQRGMDTNHPLYIIGVGAALKYVLQALKGGEYAVIPSQIAIKEPFKVEGDIIYIPPWRHVRDELQKKSAYSGLDNDDVLNYCKRFLKFAESVVPKDRMKLIEPLKEIIDKRKTVSDEILEHARKLGFRRKDELTNKASAEIALEHSKRLFKEIVFTRKIIREYS